MPLSRDYYEEVGRSIETGEAPATDWTQESARKAGLPEEFWRYALGRETGNLANPLTAVSPAGARGTAQLMPSTALDIQKRHGIDTSTPYGNVLGGATYMKEMLDKAGKYTDDPELQHRLALAQYNAGPTRVAQAINDLRGQGLPITWEAISARLPGETQSYAGKYTYTPAIMAISPSPQLLPPPALAGIESPISQKLRSVGETVEKAYELPGIKQFGQVMGAQKGAVESGVLQPLLGYKEGTLGEQVGKPIREKLTEVGVPGPLAGLAQAGAQFFTDMYTDPLYWELTGAGAALGSAFGGVGAVPGGVLGGLAAGAGRLLQQAPRLVRGLVTGLKVAQTGFRGQMALQAASQAPRGLAEIIENPSGAEGWKNLGEAGLAGWYTAHDFLRKPATQTGRVKVSEMVNGNLVEMDPARARDILSTGSMGDVVDLIDAGVQEKWTALADAGWVPRMELPEFHALFDPQGTDRARAISEPRTNEHTGRIGVDLGHLAADIQSLPPEQRVKGFVSIVNEVVNHEVSHLLNVAGLPHDPRLPAGFRKEMGELRRVADIGNEGGMPFEQYVAQRDALLAKYGVTPDLLYGDPYSIAREISDSESPENAIGRHLARLVGADPDQFVKEFKADPQGVLARYDFSPVSRMVNGLETGLQKLQARTLGALQPRIEGQRTPEEIIARMGGVQLRGLGVEPTAPAPSLEPPPGALRAEGEKPPDEAGRRGFRFGPTTKGGAEALRGAAVHPRFAAWTREGRVAATPEKPLKTKPTPTTGMPTEEMFEPQAKPVRTGVIPPPPGELLDQAAEIKRTPKVEKGRGARTLNVEDLLKGKMRAEGESDFASLPKPQQEQVVEELHNRKEISDSEYYAALDRIDRGWAAPPKGVIPREEKITKAPRETEPTPRLPRPPALEEPSPVEKEAIRRAQLESATGKAVSKMGVMGMGGRLTPEQKKVKKEAAEVTERAFKRTPEELERERMRTKEAQERRIPTEDAFRIVLERVGGRKIDLTDKDREQIRYELGVTPTEAKVYQVTNKWAKEPEAPARRAPIRGVRELGPRAAARETMRQVVAEYNRTREEREKARRGELPPPPAAKPEEMTDEQARARLKEIEAKLRMRAEGEGRGSFYGERGLYGQSLERLEDLVEATKDRAHKDPDYVRGLEKLNIWYDVRNGVEYPKSKYVDSKEVVHEIWTRLRNTDPLLAERLRRESITSVHYDPLQDAMLTAPVEQGRAHAEAAAGLRRMHAEGEKEDYFKKVEEIGTAPRGERFRASVNIPLTPQGKRDAEVQGRKFAKLGGFDEIYHDNQIRTQATAEAFAKAMPNAKVVDLGDKTQSQALGGLEGQPVNARTLAETQRLVENPDERPAGRGPESTRDGETFNEFLKRYLPVIDELHAKAQKEGLKIALVTHNRNIQAENARLAKEGEEGRGRSVDPEVMKEKGPEVGTVNKVIDHATQDWTGKPLEPGLYLVRHAQTAWNPAPTPGLKPPPRLAVSPEEAEKIGVTSKRASVGTKTRSVADVLGAEAMKKFRAEGEPLRFERPLDREKEFSKKEGEDLLRRFATWRKENFDSLRPNQPLKEVLTKDKITGRDLEIAMQRSTGVWNQAGFDNMDVWNSRKETVNKFLSTVGFRAMDIRPSSFGEAIEEVTSKAKEGVKPSDVMAEYRRSKMKVMKAEGEDQVDLFSGGGSDFWTTRADRAASYGPVRKVTVPREVFEAGKTRAAKLGQPSRFDTVLPNEWVKQSKAAPELKPDVYEIRMRAAGEKPGKMKDLREKAIRAGMRLAPDELKPGESLKSALDRAWAESEAREKAAKPTPDEPVPEWLRSAALRSQRMALRKALKGGEHENKSWEDLKKAFYAGELPSSASDPMNRLVGIGAQPAEIEKLPGFTGKQWDKTWEILGAPRALITSLDLSGILRQGAIGTAAMLVRHPLVLGKAIGKSIVTLGSESSFKEAMKRIEGSDDYHALKAMGVDFAKIEEQFTGGHYVESLLHKLHVPDFVRGSERAYSYYLTRLRYELGKGHIDALRRMGFVDAPVYEQMESGAIRTRLTGKDAEVFRKAGQWVNIATGRGGLPQGPSKFARTIRSADGFLNSILFSPRLMYSRLALFNPLTYTRIYSAARKSGAGRIQASRALWSMHALDMSSYFGMMMAMGAGLTLLNPDSKLESDMLSSDFGQIRMGNTRIDVTGGTRTYITALARLILRQTKTEYGNIKYQSAYDTLTNFLRGKLSPTASLGVNLAAGENLIGKPMYATLRDVFEGKTPVDQDSVQKILEETGGQIGLQTALPMILADAYSLVQEHGWTAPQTLPLMGGLALGVGVSTREPIEGASKELQDVMRETLVSPLMRQGKVATGVKDLLGQSIQVELSERQKDEIEKLVNVPYYQMLSKLVQQPNFKTLPAEAQRMMLVSILAQAKKLQRPYGLMKIGPEELSKEIQEGIVPEEFGRLSPPPAFASKARRFRPTDIRSLAGLLSSEAPPEEES